MTLGDQGIKGLGFTHPGDDPGAGVYHRGFNAMMYMNPPPSGQMCPRLAFSDSQAEQLKRILRTDIRIDSGFASDGIGAPYALGYTARRDLLGDMRARWGFDRLDFDGDGKRDLAVFQPPVPPDTTYKFRVLTSSSGFATVLERTFGIAGDVPVPADYDGDGTTDFAVLRRGGITPTDPFDSQFYWIWCKSSQAHDCSTPQTNNIQWGYQKDVPLPGLEFDGNTTTKEVAVYRPTNGYVYWRVIGQTTQGSIYTRAESTIVHLHGLYDTDNKTDLVFYNPANARFWMLLSTTNPPWDYAQGLARYFPVVLRPDAVGASDSGAQAPAVRHGAVALEAENNGKKVLRAWDAYTGNWYTNWTPVTSDTVQTCQWGLPRDVPLSGPIDSDQNGFSDMLVYRPTGTSSPYIYIARPNPTSCYLSTTSLSVSPASARTIPAAVRDMNNDGRGDLLLLDPDTFGWHRYYSNGTTFTSQSWLYLGNLGGMAL